MPDQTPEARLAAALYVALRDTDTTQFYDSDSPMDDFSAAVLKATLEADPTLAADLALAAAVTFDSLLKVIDLNSHYNPDTNEFAMNDSPSDLAAAIIKAAKEASE